MSRASIGSLRLPRGSRLVADFTDGSIPSAAIVTDSGTPSAVGRAYSYDSRGVQLSFTGGTTGQYASFKWEPAIASPGATIDLSDSDWLGLECEWPPGTGAVYAAVSIFLTTQTGTTYTNYQNRSITSGAEKTPRRQILMARLNADTWTKVGGGPTSLAALGKFEVRLGVHSSLQNIPANMFVRKIWIGKSRTKVMLSFDDGMDGQINYAYPSLEAAGFKAVLHAPAQRIGGAGRLTEADLATLYAAGWDFGIQQFDDSNDIPVNYAGASGLTSDGAGTATWVNVSNIPHLLVPNQSVTVRGAASPEYNGTVRVLTTPNAYTFTYAITGTPVTPDPGWATCERLSKKDAMVAWQRCIDWYAERGYTRGNEFAAYSNGVTDEWVESWMPELGFKMARTTRINAIPNRGFDPRCSDEKALLRLPAVAMDQQTAATVLGHVDTAIDRGCSVLLYGHDIDPTPAVLTITKSEWDLMVAGLVLRSNQGLIDVVSQTEFMRQLSIGRASSS